VPNYTYEDYLHWEGRWEIIEGVPFAMSPAPTPKHQHISSQLQYLFTDALLNANCNHCKVYDFLDYKIAEHTVIKPDVLIVCDKIEKNFLDFKPALVVEILSPATAMKDRNSKFYLYENEEVPYFLIVDPDKETVEVFALQNGKYALVEIEVNTMEFCLGEGCTINIAKDKIWD
jgi:Uma2 family endonuclease